MPCGGGRRGAARVLARALRARGVPSAGRGPARAAYGGECDWRGCDGRRGGRGHTRCGCGRSGGERATRKEGEDAWGVEGRGATARRGGWFCGRRRGSVFATGDVVGGAVCVRLRDAAHDVTSRWDEGGRLRHHEVVRGILFRWVGACRFVLIGKFGDESGRGRVIEIVRASALGWSKMERTRDGVV